MWQAFAYSGKYLQGYAFFQKQPFFARSIGVTVADSSLEVSVDVVALPLF
jgi:hypothetical protein